MAKFWNGVLLTFATLCLVMWFVALSKHSPDAERQMWAVWGALFSIFYRLRVLESRA